MSDEERKLEPNFTSEQGSSVPDHPMPIDVLIVTALAEELSAVVALRDDSFMADVTGLDPSDDTRLSLPESNDTASANANPGQRWTEHKDSAGFPYLYREFVTRGGGRLKFAAARTVQTGETAATAAATRLIHHLKPRCLAMCGICAGMDTKVSLGDIIVANRLFKYDYGKIIRKQGGSRSRSGDRAVTGARGSSDGERTTGEKEGRRGSERTRANFQPETQTFNLDSRWVYEVQEEIQRNGARKYLVGLERGMKRPALGLAMTHWILCNLLRDPSSVTRETILGQFGANSKKAATSGDSTKSQEQRVPDPDAMTSETVGAVISTLADRGLIEIDKPLSLTESGRKAAILAQLQHGTIRDEPALRVHIGPVATGSRVVEDPQVFRSIQQQVERKVLGIEMEGAAVGMVAELERIPHTIFVKSVSDFPDRKDDRFHEFASHASAHFLVRFLLENLEPAPFETIRPANESSTDGSCTDGARQRTQEIIDAFNQTHGDERIIRIAAQESSLALPPAHLQTWPRDRKLRELYARECQALLAALGSPENSSSSPRTRVDAILDPQFDDFRTCKRGAARRLQLRHVLRMHLENKQLRVVQHQPLPHENMLSIQTRHGARVFIGKRTSHNSGYQTSIIYNRGELANIEIEAFDRLFGRLIKSHSVEAPETRSKTCQAVAEPPRRFTKPRDAHYRSKIELLVHLDRGLLRTDPNSLLRGITQMFQSRNTSRSSESATECLWTVIDAIAANHAEWSKLEHRAATGSSPENPGTSDDVPALPQPDSDDDHGDEDTATTSEPSNTPAGNSRSATSSDEHSWDSVALTGAMIVYLCACAHLRPESSVPFPSAQVCHALECNRAAAGDPVLDDALAQWKNEGTSTAKLCGKIPVARLESDVLIAARAAVEESLTTRGLIPEGQSPLSSALHRHFPEMEASPSEQREDPSSRPRGFEPQSYAKLEFELQRFMAFDDSNRRRRLRSGIAATYLAIVRHHWRTKKLGQVRDLLFHWLTAPDLDQHAIEPKYGCVLDLGDQTDKIDPTRIGGSGEAIELSALNLDPKIVKLMHALSETRQN